MLLERAHGLTGLSQARPMGHWVERNTQPDRAFTNITRVPGSSRYIGAIVSMWPVPCAVAETHLALQATPGGATALCTASSCIDPRAPGIPEGQWPLELPRTRRSAEPLPATPTA